MATDPDTMLDGAKGNPAGTSNVAAASPDNTMAAPHERHAARPKSVDELTVPAEVKALFRVDGNKYLFPDGAFAFTDRGRELATPSENRAVIKALATIARARGWETVELRGTERFRQEAWVQAAARGMAVIGYEPSVEERERVAVAAAAPDLQANSRSAGAARTAPPDTPLVGQLTEYGSARYQHRPEADRSYFVTLATRQGPRTVWGIDLERALRESETRPEVGDRIELRQMGRQKVTVKTAERNEAGEWVPTDKITHRNGWLVEKEGFLAERARAAAALRDPEVSATEAVAHHPELVGSQLYVKAARDFAARAPVPEADREKLVARVREALAERIERGEAWPTARIREPVRQPERSAGRDVELAR